MPRKIVTSIVLATILLMAASALQVVNAKTLICNNCDLGGYRSTATTAGTGNHFVTDYGKSILTRWSVYYDREMGVWMADPMEAEPWQQDAFADWAGAVKKSGRMSPQIEMTVPVDGPFWEAVMPDTTFDDANAFLLANNRTLRNQFANTWGAGIGRPGAADTVLGLAASAFLKGISAIVGDVEIKVTFVWSDGSKTVFTIDENSVSQPVYVPGESQTGNGTIIPDETAVPGTSISCPECYVGNHFFSDDRDRQRWFDNARLFGIQFVDPGAGAGTISCTWDGRTLTCSTHTI